MEQRDEQIRQLKENVVAKACANIDKGPAEEWNEWSGALRQDPTQLSILLLKKNA